MPAFTWTIDSNDAEKEQMNLQVLVNLKTSLPSSLYFRRGLAIGTSYDQNTKRCFAVAVQFDRMGRYTRAVREASVEVDFPYIPGLLAFRVGPAICSILDEVIDEVDLLLFDGQGIAHPRGLGLAAHIGVLYDKPSIGVTRNNLYGKVTGLPTGRFDRSEILDPRTGDLIGYALSLGERCDPFYVSPGHRISIEDAISILCRISGEGTCFPRPLGRAHAQANALARNFWRRTES